MEPNSEKNHLDDLFARRLGNLERPPSPDSFARLQQRMQGQQARPRMVFWRNTSVQMAAAACLAVTLLFGWLYTNDQSAVTVSDGSTVAVNSKKQPTTEPVPENQPVAQRAGNEKTASQLADNNPVSEQAVMDRKSSGPSIGKQDRTLFRQKPQVANAPLKATVQTEVKVEPMTDKPVTTPKMIAAVPNASVAPKAPTERVLIVTIEESEALVAARQTARSVVNNMPVLAASPTKEGKASFWGQVKRLKQDDDVARQEGSTDESGLLSRAYKGIRQKLEKDKPAKQ